MAWHEDWKSGDSDWTVSGMIFPLRTGEGPEAPVLAGGSPPLLAQYRHRIYQGDESISADVRINPARHGGAAVLYLESDAPCGGKGLPCHGYAFRVRDGEGASILSYASGRPMRLAGPVPVLPKLPPSFRLMASRRGRHLALAMDGVELIGVDDVSRLFGLAGFGIFAPASDAVALGAFEHLGTRSKNLGPEIFKPYPENPVLSASLPWEEQAVFEPSPIKDGAAFLMSYSGGWTKGALGLAKSDDGIHWEKCGPDPVLGQGAGGEEGHALRSNLMKVDGAYRIYYSDSAGNIRMAESKDGRAFVRASAIVIPEKLLPDVTTWASQGYLREGKNWWALVEGQYAKGAMWRLHLFRSVDNGLSFKLVAGPLASLQVGYGAWCSPRAFFKIKGRYHVWYHVSDNAALLPTVLWHASSADMIHWAPDAFRSLGQEGSAMGLKSPDQVADPDMLEHDGNVLLYYDATDNANSAAKIGVATRPGSIEGLLKFSPAWEDGDR